MGFLIVDVYHCGTVFALPDVPAAVGLVQVDLVLRELLLAIFADLEVFLFFHRININIKNDQWTLALERSIGWEKVYNLITHSIYL